VALVLTSAGTLLTANADVWSIPPTWVATIGSLASTIPTIMRELGDPSGGTKTP